MNTSSAIIKKHLKTLERRAAGKHSAWVFISVPLDRSDPHGASCIGQFLIGESRIYPLAGVTYESFLEAAGVANKLNEHIGVTHSEMLGIAAQLLKTLLNEQSQMTLH